MRKFKLCQWWLIWSWAEETNSSEFILKRPCLAGPETRPCWCSWFHVGPINKWPCFPLHYMVELVWHYISSCNGRPCETLCLVKYGWIHFFSVGQYQVVAPGWSGTQDLEGFPHQSCKDSSFHRCGAASTAICLWNVDCPEKGGPNIQRQTYKHTRTHTYYMYIIYTYMHAYVNK